jgi:FMN phosphatase YigB (HAD superfamily)
MHVWVFDNDGTLYEDGEAHAQFGQIVFEFVKQTYDLKGLDPKYFLNLLKGKWNTRSSVVALMREYKVEFETLVSETFLRIDFTTCSRIVPNIESRVALDSITSTKVVLTNNPSAYAEKVLHHINLLDLFVEVIGVEKTEFEGKPHDSAYVAVEQRFPQATKIIFCDDILENLDAAKNRGWETVLFDPSGKIQSSSHKIITSLSELK